MCCQPSCDLVFFYDIERTSNKLWLHLSVNKRKIHYDKNFDFKPVTKKFVKNIVKDLSTNKETGEDLPL